MNRDVVLENPNDKVLGHIFKLRSIRTSSVVRSLEKDLHFLPCFVDVNRRLRVFLWHAIHIPVSVAAIWPNISY